jgi:hypothetical protein
MIGQVIGPVTSPNPVLNQGALSAEFVADHYDKSVTLTSATASVVDLSIAAET